MRGRPFRAGTRGSRRSDSGQHSPAGSAPRIPEPGSPASASSIRPRRARRSCLPRPQPATSAPRGSRRPPVRRIRRRRSGSPGSRSRCARRRNGSCPPARARRRRTSCTGRPSSRSRSPSSTGSRPSSRPSPGRSSARDPGQHRLDLSRNCWRAFGRRAGAEARADLAARVVDEDPACAGLGARHLPGVLVAGVGVGLAVAAERVPVAVVELDVELRVGAHPQLLDRGVLDAARSRLSSSRVAQDRERQRQHDAVGGHRARAGPAGRRGGSCRRRCARIAVSAAPVVI